MKELIKNWNLRAHSCQERGRSEAAVAIEQCRSELSALLAQHAVAEPQNEKWHGFIGGLNGNPEFCKYCGEPEQSYRHAHAAEQPKLTEEQVRRAINRSLQPALAREVVSIEILTTLLNEDLLTSPVAPPPSNDKREGAERTARLLCETRGHTGRRPCDFCQMQIDACLRETEPLRTCHCGTPKEPHCESVHAEPPVAPGEPPSREASSSPLKCVCQPIHAQNCAFRDARSSQYRNFYRHETGAAQPSPQKKEDGK